MHQPDDSGLLKAALGLVLGRRRAPASLRGRVMAAVRAERAGSPARREPGRTFAWLPRRANWAFGACAAAAVSALVLLVVPSPQDRIDSEEVALQGAELELAEALQLAGHNWNRAQEAALSPIQEDRDD